VNTYKQRRIQRVYSEHFLLYFTFYFTFIIRVNSVAECLSDNDIWDFLTI